MLGDHYIRQILHWKAASERLGDFSLHGAQQPWDDLEQYTNLSIRDALSKSQRILLKQSKDLEKLWMGDQITRLQAKQKIQKLKSSYLRTETMFDFFLDAINSRSGNHLSTILRSCDVITWRSMSRILSPLGHNTPPVLTYIDKGLGASILKAGLRLWDGSTENPVAMIKVVRHNLLRPTSLIHEAGHQIAHILNWNEEMRQILLRYLRSDSVELAEIWSSWSSEIVADAFGFVNAGYGSVASLHDLVSGTHQNVFRFIPGDPHPISYLRVLLGAELSKVAFGSGPWINLAKQWSTSNKIEEADQELRSIIKHSESLLPKIARICLKYRFETLAGKSISTIIPTQSIHPIALKKDFANGQFENDKWILNQDPIKLLALSSWKITDNPSEQLKFTRYQYRWMKTIGTYQPSFI